MQLSPTPTALTVSQLNSYVKFLFEGDLKLANITVEGEILIPDDGLWKETEVFESFAAAKTWLNGKAGIS